MCVLRALPTSKLGAYSFHPWRSVSSSPTNPSLWCQPFFSLFSSTPLSANPSHGFSWYGARISKDGSTRHLFESRNTKHHPNNCGELVAQSQCSQNSKCSWCTSEDLDDMCFSFATTGAPAEAWRLPQQVYSCSLIRWDPLCFLYFQVHVVFQ